MKTVVILFSLPLAVGVAYAISLVLALRLQAVVGELLSGRWAAVEEGLRVELSIDHGPRRVIVDTITVEPGTALVDEARAPEGFAALSAAPVPAIEDFEPDLDELAIAFPDGDVPTEVVEEELRRQFEEWRGLDEATAAATVRWSGRLRLHRGRSAPVLIPIRPDLDADVLITFGFRYRVGLVGAADSFALRVGGPR